MLTTRDEGATMAEHTEQAVDQGGHSGGDSRGDGGGDGGGHDDGHGSKAVIAALVANVGIAIAKFVAWLVTGASSMLAESIHSVADSGNQVLLLIGGRRAKRAPTREHPFGYGRERYVYAFIVSVVLFSVGGLFSLYEAYHKWHELYSGKPDELLESRWWWVPLVVLTFGIVLEGFSLRTAVKQADPKRRGRSWMEFIRETKAPELPVILMEDFAALVGLTLALSGVGLALLTDNAYWDVVGAAGIGTLLVVVAVILAIETRSMLLGEAAAPDARERIHTALDEAPGLAGVIHLRTLHVGPDKLLVGAKVAVVHDDSAASVARAINEAEERVRAAEPDVYFIYLEPDLRHGEDGAADRRPTDSAAHRA